MTFLYLKSAKKIHQNKYNCAVLFLSQMYWGFIYASKYIFVINVHCKTLETYETLTYVRSVWCSCRVFSLTSVDGKRERQYKLRGRWGGGEQLCRLHTEISPSPHNSFQQLNYWYGQGHGGCRNSIKSLPHTEEEDCRLPGGSSSTLLWNAVLT